MVHITLCPCGSRKPFEECCGGNAGVGKKIRQIMIWGSILAIVGVMTALGISSQKKAVVDAEPLPVAQTSSTPKPWEYNPITNQHWDPTTGHNHWHAGPPPADRIATGLPGQTTPDTVNDAVVANPVEQNSLLPSVQNPEPWQYDQASNKHYNPTPGHEHWHDGPPPDGVVQGGATPVPWEYDAINDRHWHPEHAHWHPGPGPGRDPNGGG